MTEPFSVASGAVGVVTLGVTLCQGLLQYYNSWKNSQKDVAAMYASLEGLSKTFRLLESTIRDHKFNQAIIDRVTASIDLCEAGVNELDAKLLKVKNTAIRGIDDQIRGQFRRALYPFKESTLLDLRETVSDLRDNLSLAISTLQLDVSATSLQKLDTFDGNLACLMGSSSTLVNGVTKVQLSQAEHEKRIRFERRLTIIRWLSPLQFGDKQKDTLGRRQEGTGGWLLREKRFIDWLEGKIRTLWCPGMPGAGKTILASVIVDHLQRNIQSSNVAVAYIYCNYKEHNQTAANIVASVVQQLTQQQLDLTEEIFAAYDHHDTEGTTPSLLEYLELLRSQIRMFPKVLIVIDALDECLDGDRAVLLDELQSLSPAPYLLVTSRHIPTIERGFREAASLEIVAKGEDVRMFLEVWLDQQVLWVRLVKADPPLREHIVSTILAKSHGMFLLAVLHTNLLAGEDNKRDLLKALRNLPIEIDNTYDQAMLRIEDQSRQQIRRAEQVLSWVTLAERPLTVKELQHALAVEPGDTFLDEDALPDEDLMVSVCAGLVVVDKQKGIIRLVHYTTQDYLERTLDVRYPHAQRNICATCITYLSFKVFSDGPFQAERFREKMRARLKENILLAYAGQNWGNHARKAPTHDAMIVDELVRGFFCKKGNVSISSQVTHYLMCSTAAPMDVTPLNVAAFFGLEKTVVTLLQEGHDINAKSSFGFSVLYMAAGTEHGNIVEILLKKGANFEARARNGSTALHRAAAAGREHSVRILLERGYDPTYDVVGTKSMVGNAAYKGHAKVVQLLLLHIGDIKRRNDCAVTALDMATSGGQEDVAIMLLEEFADLEVADKNAAAMLHRAAYDLNNVSVLRLLLKHAHAIKLSHGNIQNALWSAVSKTNGSAIRLLLDAGADPKRPDKRQDPILHYPIKLPMKGSENLAVVKMLVEAGGDIDLADSKGWTPLLLAAKDGRTEILRFLLEMGANPAAEEQRTGRRALEWAAVAGDQEAVDLLLRRQNESTAAILKWSTLAQLFQAVRKDTGAILPEILRDMSSLDPRDGEVLNLWHLVAKKGPESTIEALLNVGVNIEAKNELGYTALCLAAKVGHEGIVQLLARQGARLDAESDFNSNGRTPLSNAAENMHVGVVRLLLDAGAKVETENQHKTGTTPLNTVLSVRKIRSRDFETIVQMLLEHGADIEVPKNDRLDARTPLIMTACRPSCLTVLRLLLDKRANIEAKDTKAKTALYRAAECGAINNVRLLLERGADPKSVDLATIKPRRFESKESYDESLRLIRDAQQERNAWSDIASKVGDQVTEGETDSTDAGGQQMIIL